MISSGRNEDIIDLISGIAKDNSEEMMNIHFAAFEDRRDDFIHDVVCRWFKEHGAAGEEFLLNKLKQNQFSEETLADIIQVLGSMKCKSIPELVEPYLDGRSELLLYKAIITMGWCGNRSSLDLLEKPLHEAKDPLMRGYAATAMRQIWYQYTKTGPVIIQKMAKTLADETDSLTLALIMISVQSILFLSFGMREILTPLSECKLRGNGTRSKKKFLAYLDEHPEVCDETQVLSLHKKRLINAIEEAIVTKKYQKVEELVWALCNMHVKHAIETHFEFLENYCDEEIYEIFFRNFYQRKDKEDVERFLLEQIKRKDLSDETRADVIDLLGTLHCKEIPILVEPYLNENSDILFQQSLLALGCIGERSTIDFLEPFLYTVRNPATKGCVMTAMQYILFAHKEFTPIVISKLVKALEMETDDAAKPYIIARLQILVNKTFGIREVNHKQGKVIREFKGDVERAKKRLLMYLAKHPELLQENS